jgi:hypothetical protein
VRNAQKRYKKNNHTQNKIKKGYIGLPFKKLFLQRPSTFFLFRAQIAKEDLEAMKDELAREDLEAIEAATHGHLEAHASTHPVPQPPSEGGEGNSQAPSGKPLGAHPNIPDAWCLWVPLMVPAGSPHLPGS